MRNVKFLMEYDGRDFCGYQIQPKQRTVQGDVQAALAQITGEKVEIIGCSRTDSGVHAKQYCFNAFFKNPIPCDGLRRALNSILPHDISIFSCEDMHEGFHARYDCKGKEYLYIIDNRQIRSAFNADRAMHYPYSLNLEQMNHAAQLLKGEHDFAAFCKAESLAHLKSTVRQITDCHVQQQEELVKVYVSGTGFLHNMVRIIVGSLIYVSEGKRTLDDIRQALETGERALAGVTVVPDGLYLNKVFY